MAEILQIRRDITANRLAYTPAQGELFMDVTLTELFLGDGSTAGGQPLEFAQAAAAQQSEPTNPTGTTSTTPVMMGLAGAITPVATGSIMAILSGDVFNSILADGAEIQLVYGTGTAPINGAASTGTAVGKAVHMTAAVASAKVPFSIQALVPGLGFGTAYWFDAQLNAITGGTATIENLSLTLFEL